MAKIFGIDVSKHNGKIDWKKVKADGVAFAIIRCGYCNNDGSIEVDPQFKTNMDGAIKAGVAVGVYVYSYATSVDAARKAAQNVLDMVKGYNVTYPLCWDFEDEKWYGKNTKAQNTALCKAALEVWEKAGWYAMLYTYKSFAENRLNMADLTAYDFWLAHYTSATTYKGSYGMWQYSSTGTVDGMEGNVDLNWAYKDYPALVAKFGLNKAAVNDEISDLKATIAKYEEERKAILSYAEAIRKILL